MRRLVKILLIACIGVGCALWFSACAEKEEQPSAPSEAKSYVIYYTFDDEPCTIEVKSGAYWRIEADKLPKKAGYVFDGLFDAPVGGTQYTSASGNCLELYAFEQDTLLFPQFTPIAYTLELDYGEFIPSDSSLSLNVESVGVLLPSNLTVGYQAWKHFEGWYTQKDCNGVKVADTNGKMLVSLLDIVGENDGTKVRLYAGVSVDTYKIKFLSETGVALTTLDVEHGTPFDEIAPKVEYNEKTIVSWKKSPSATTAFSENVVSALTLYPFVYNVKIVFQANGGAEIADRFVGDGETVLLPDMAREHYEFLGWYAGTVRLEDEFTPTKNTILNAKWERIGKEISFNTNGGTPINAYLVTDGTTSVLPTTTREGYDLESWTYQTESGQTEEFISGYTLVRSDITLTAKWKFKSVYYDSGERKETITDAEFLTKDKIDLSSLSVFLNENYKITFHISFTMREIEDGYQELYLCRENTEPKDAVAKNTAHEYSVAGKIETWGTEKFSWTVNGNKCADKMVMKYCAHGQGVDDWLLGRVTITVTVAEI